MRMSKIMDLRWVSLCTKLLSEEKAPPHAEFAFNSRWKEPPRCSPCSPLYSWLTAVVLEISIFGRGVGNNTVRCSRPMPGDVRHLGDSCSGRGDALCSSEKAIVTSQ